MKLYTSQEILQAEDLYELQDTFSSSAIPFQYEMTEGELGWLEFIKNRYSIYNWITENLEDDILTFDDPFSMSEALYDDGMPPKAVMLSDDSALQRLFFWLYNEID